MCSSLGYARQVSGQPLLYMHAVDSVAIYPAITSNSPFAGVLLVVEKGAQDPRSLASDVVLQALRSRYKEVSCRCRWWRSSPEHLRQR
jgi:hypothetical protein